MKKNQAARNTKRVVNNSPFSTLAKQLGLFALFMLLVGSGLNYSTRAQGNVLGSSRYAMVASEPDGGIVPVATIKITPKITASPTPYRSSVTSTPIPTKAPVAVTPTPSPRPTSYTNLAVPTATKTPSPTPYNTSSTGICLQCRDQKCISWNATLPFPGDNSCITTVTTTPTSTITAKPTPTPTTIPNGTKRSCCDVVNGLSTCIRVIGTAYISECSNHDAPSGSGRKMFTCPTLTGLTMNSSGQYCSTNGGSSKPLYRPAQVKNLGGVPTNAGDACRGSLPSGSTGYQTMTNWTKDLAKFYLSSCPADKPIKYTAAWSSCTTTSTGGCAGVAGCCASVTTYNTKSSGDCGAVDYKNSNGTPYDMSGITIGCEKNCPSSNSSFYYIPVGETRLKTGNVSCTQYDYNNKRIKGTTCCAWPK